MRILNPKLLAEFRAPGRCHLCGRFCAVREGHHLWKRQMGGGNQQDVRINLICVGSTPMMLCPCHGEMESGAIDSSSVILKVAQREGVLQPDIVTVMRFIRILSRHSTARDVARGTEEWNQTEKELLRRTFLEADLDHLLGA